MPKPRERLWGLSRTTLLELIELGAIRSALIRKPGSLKGIRLIYLPSLNTYLAGCVEEPKPKPSGPDQNQNREHATSFETKGEAACKNGLPVANATLTLSFQVPRRSNARNSRKHFTYRTLEKPSLRRSYSDVTQTENQNAA